MTKSKTFFIYHLAIFESDEDKKGVILDYTSDGKIVGVEILNASTQMPNPMKVEYEVA
jgi:uncharacterized protein YuzE